MAKKKRKGGRDYETEVARGVDRGLRREARRVLAGEPLLLGGGKTKKQKKSKRKSLLSADTVMTLAQFNPAVTRMLADPAGLSQYAPSGAAAWQPPAAAMSRAPSGLDDAGRALHALIASKAAATGKHYFSAMSAVTGQPKYSQLSDIPPTPVQQAGLDPEREVQDAAARALAAHEGISWFDALELLDNRRELAALEADDGSAAVPWLDSRPLLTPPKPYSDADWERDSRRAQAGGVDVDREAWRAGAEQGRDLIGELADAKRSDAIAARKQHGAGLLDQARAQEDDRRGTAINSELVRRARQRAAEGTRAQTRGGSDHIAPGELASQYGQRSYGAPPRG